MLSRFAAQHFSTFTPSKPVNRYLYSMVSHGICRSMRRFTLDSLTHLRPISFHLNHINTSSMSDKSCTNDFNTSSSGSNNKSQSLQSNISKVNNKTLKLNNINAFKQAVVDKDMYRIESLINTVEEGTLSYFETKKIIIYAISNSRDTYLPSIVAALINNLSFNLFSQRWMFTDVIDSIINCLSDKISSFQSHQDYNMVWEEFLKIFQFRQLKRQKVPLDHIAYAYVAVTKFMDSKLSQTLMDDVNIQEGDDKINAFVDILTSPYIYPDFIMVGSSKLLIDLIEWIMCIIQL